MARRGIEFQVVAYRKNVVELFVEEHGLTCLRLAWNRVQRAMIDIRAGDRPPDPLLPRIASLLSAGYLVTSYDRADAILAWARRQPSFTTDEGEAISVSAIWPPAHPTEPPAV